MTMDKTTQSIVVIVACGLLVAAAVYNFTRRRERFWNFSGLARGFAWRKKWVPGTFATKENSYISRYPGTPPACPPYYTDIGTTCRLNGGCGEGPKNTYYGSGGAKTPRAKCTP